MSITHHKVATIADDPSAEVGKDEWNEAHDVDLDLPSNIRDYGASTASADNAVAIQAALDAFATTGRPIYIPEGTWLTSPLTSSTQGLAIFGAGRTKSILKPVAGTGTVLTLSGPMAGCRFRDFGIDGTGGTGHGLYYSGTADPDWLYSSSFEDLAFSNCALNGLYIKNSFANRFVNITVSGNGHDQIKVWGGQADYYERIGIYSTVSGYGGLRCIEGGTFVGINGIYDVTHADGPMFKFGGDGTGESDGVTRFPRVTIIGTNVEAFATTGMLFVNSPGQPVLLNGVVFQTASGVANCRAIDEAFATNIPMILTGCQFGLVGGATWANGYAIHADLPIVADASDGSGMPTLAYSDGDAVPYYVAGSVYGAGNANFDAYLYRRHSLNGATDVAYLASAGLGNINTGAGFVHRTAAPAMPTSGTYIRGDIVDNCSNTIAEQGAGGSKYTLTGWRRLTDGSAHVLNTDWVERRELTGN